MEVYIKAVQVLVDKGMSIKKACEEAAKIIKKTAFSSPNNKYFISTITDIEKKYNLDDGQVYEEKSGESIDVTAEDAAKYIFKGWNNGKEI